MDDGAPFYVFLLAMQSPNEPCFAVAERIVEPIAYLGAADQVWLRHNLRITPTFVPYSKLPFTSTDFVIKVISDLSFGQDGLMRSGSFEQSLLEWEQDCPLHVPVQAPRAPSASKTKLEQLLEKYPWLDGYMKAGGVAGSKGAYSAVAKTDRAHMDDDDCDEALASAWLEVDDKLRDVLREASGLQLFLRMRGDVVGAEASKGLPRLFCKSYGLIQAVSFSVARYLNTDHCLARASEWSRRCSFFYQIWLAADDPEFLFRECDLDSLPRDPAWEAAEPSFGLAAAERAAAIDDMYPRLVRWKIKMVLHTFLPLQFLASLMTSSLCRSR